MRKNGLVFVLLLLLNHILLATNVKYSENGRINVFDPDYLYNLKVYQNRTELNHQLCVGDTLHLADTFFTTNGSFEEIKIDPEGSEEYTLHHFEFSSPIVNEVVLNACEGDTITINNTDYTTSTMFDQVFTAEGGCDSIVHYNIVFDEVLYKTVQHEVREGRGIPNDTLFLRDTFFTHSSVYFERVEVESSCDTIIEHRIFFNTMEIIFDDNLNRSFCVGERVSLTYEESYLARQPYKELIKQVNENISGGQNIAYSSNIMINSFPPNSTINSVQDISFVGISMDHPRVTDLDVILKCPSGQSIELQRHTVLDQTISMDGDSIPLFFTTPFLSETWEEFAVDHNGRLFTGFNYGSYESFEKLVGCPLNGKWELTVEDFWTNDSGRWFNWSLGFPGYNEVHPIKDLAFWGWSVVNASSSEITVGNRIDPFVLGFPHGEVFPHKLGNFVVMNEITHIGKGLRADATFPIRVAAPYAGPTQPLDTLFCGPTFLYDTLITETGTYNLMKQVPDYCTSIPILAKVTIVYPDSTFLNATTCEFAESDLMIETLTNQYGCDSLIFTGLQLVVDTVFSQDITCLPNITTINRSFETLEVVVENGCDYVSVIEHLEVPVDTIYLEEIVCNPDEAGETLEVFPNQFGCDSVVIINHILQLDTTYLTTTTCQFEEEGVQQTILTNQYGCDSLIITDVILDVDTVYTSSTACGPADISVDTEVITENINVADGCDYVSVQEVLTAPTDTTYLITPSCQLRDTMQTFEILSNQYGCDSVIITDYNLRLDTLTKIINTCTTGIAAPQQSVDMQWEINNNTCDTFHVTITNLLPLDTFLVTTSSCNPQDTGIFFNTLSNQYQCDSLVITQVLFDPDTNFVEINTCYPQDSGWHFKVLTQEGGCQLLEWEYRRYQPLTYHWQITPDTCGFGKGSATFVPANTSIEYTFNWDGPAAEINPEQIFRGVYTVTITAEGDFYQNGCVDTTSVIIGNISGLPQVSYTYTANELTYSFASEFTEVDSFYWDFGDGNTSNLANPEHTYAHTGTYTVCLFGENSCDIEQVCQVIRTINGYNISGKVETAPNFLSQAGINGVEMTLSKANQDLFAVTGQSGEFSFPDQLEGYTYQINPQKEDLPLNGLDVSDVLKIALAANGTYNLNIPYELLAADVDCNEGITIEDAFYLNDLLLGNQENFPANCSSWLFWPQSYVFPNPEQPFGYETTISINDLQQPESTNHFYGLKRGDLGGNADPQRTPLGPDTLFLSLENGPVESGDTLHLDFRVRHFNELGGVQFEFVFDTLAFAFLDLASGDLEVLNLNEDFGLNAIDQGFLRFVWVDLLGQTYTLEDNAVLFRLRLLAKQKIIDRSARLGLTERNLSATCFNGDLEEGPVRLVIDELTDISSFPTPSFYLGNNRPNPFNTSTIIPFTLPGKAAISLKVYNQLGQLIWQKKGQYQQGASEIEVRLTSPGLFYYTLETPWGKATRRMVMVEQ